MGTPIDEIQRVLNILFERRDAGTADANVRALPTISETETTVDTRELGWRRSEARLWLNIAGEAHQESHFKQWTRLSSARGRLGTVQLLDEIADLGFARRDVARLLGVTVQAIQKWRRGASATADNKAKLAGLLAACDLIAENYEIQEIASWFEMPIMPGVPISPIDLWVSQRPDLVFEYASGHTDADDTLTSWDLSWREKYGSDFEVFRAADGHLSLRPKDR
jgi:transcriptional regulator with XRE-family HTH domain